MQPQPETVVTPFEAKPRQKAAPRLGKAEVSAELRELKDRYISWMIATRYADETVRGQHHDLEFFYRYLAMQGVLRIADVTTELLEAYSLWLRERPNAYHAGKTIATNTVYYRIHAAKQFFKWLAQNMIVLQDPAEDLELPRFTRGLPQVILTQEEARRLLDAPDLRSPVGYRDKAVLEVVYATGIRSGELRKLKVSDFDAKARTLFVHQGKGGKDRIIPLPARAAGYLAEYLDKVRPRFAKRMKGGDDGTLFLNFTGGRLNKRDQLRAMFDRCCKPAGIDKHVTCMVLRHSIATHLLENGMGLRYIQEFLGHEDMRTTTLYSKVTLKGLRKHYNKHHPKERRAKRLKAAPSEIGGNES
jgi:integrase/recombinase XerD